MSVLVRWPGPACRTHQLHRSAWGHGLMPPTGHTSGPRRQSTAASHRRVAAWLVHRDLQCETGGVVEDCLVVRVTSPRSS